MKARWYFDFISPFAYLQWQRLHEIADIELDLKPVLFAGLLDHHGQKGPAEIDSKRRHTYRYVVWRARELGVPLTFPPAHPFNPLVALRLCIAAGATPRAVTAIFDHIWRDGGAADGPAMKPVATELGVEDVDDAVATPAVKEALHANFRCAIADGVFGVPTIVADGNVFWGEDATDFFRAYLSDPSILTTAPFAAADRVPVGKRRSHRIDILPR